MTAASHDAAIAAALTQNWKEAIRINLELVKSDKNNIDVLNRFGYAQLMSGQLTAAKRTFNKVVKLDPYNQIALKNLKKLGAVRQKDLKKQPGALYPLTFLEEPGKTKIIECVHPAPMPTLSTLSPGQEVVLRPKNHVVEIRNESRTYLGALPDDLSFRLLKLLAGGNRYQVFIKSIGKNSLMVFLREVSRGKRFANQPSFTPSRTYIPFSHEIPRGDSSNITPGEEKEVAEEE